MSAGAVLEVVEPGLLTTVQDAGRPGLGAQGITAGGAADPHSLAVANALLANPPGAAALELTLAGGALRALRHLTLAIAGADLGARVLETDEGVAPGRTVVLREGETLAFGTAPPGGGCRAYLALPGGVGVRPVLGSRSTALGAGFGGFGGRPLREGDRLAVLGPGLDRPAAHWTGPVTEPGVGPLRVLSGPHGASEAGGGLAARLASRAWTVSPTSDRTGLRLVGEPLAAGTGSLASHGVVAGAVQLPPDGRPIVLLADHQPTGGYPVVAVVARVDRPRLGQLAPGDGLRFELVEEAEARRLDAGRRSTVDAALDHLREAAAWEALWRGAGG